MMKKKIILFSFTVITTNKIFAQSNVDDIISNNLNTIIILTLVIAISALALAIINTFKVEYNKKVREVNLVNQKDDLNVSMDAIKVTLSKDIRGIKRDLSKIERTAKTAKPQSISKKVTENTEEIKTEESQSTEKKPFKKRPFNKRKPFYKKQAAKKNEQKGNEPNSNE